MKILIADDEKAVRELVRFAFERRGFDVVEAADGMETLNIARQELPDLVLLDAMMPGLSGYDVCRQLKELEATKETPIVFLSAKGQAYEVAEGLEAGAVAYVIKPFSPKELVTQVEEVLRRHLCRG
jgi:DNA-binding response OmpR family regulator